MAECKYRPTERVGLYIMVVIILIHVVHIMGALNKMEKDLAAVKAAVVKVEAPK